MRAAERMTPDNAGMCVSSAASAWVNKVFYWYMYFWAAHASMSKALMMHCSMDNISLAMIGRAMQ